MCWNAGRNSSVYLYHYHLNPEASLRQAKRRNGEAGAPIPGEEVEATLGIYGIPVELIKHERDEIMMTLVAISLRILQTKT